MNNAPSRLSKAVVALVLSGAGATAIATQFVGEKEGLALTAYQDGAAVWTICRGHTAGVRPGMTATKDQCDRLTASDLGQSFDEIDRLVTVPMSEPQRAAVVSFCAYNLGLDKCARSTFIRKLNARDYAGACAEIPKWVYVGGKDCRDPDNNCRGIVERRQQEAELCRR
ncbi:MAG TPA: lysozyme [Candidatus Sulfotelmatobacter sp.]|jgi:lysozyme|nr:lysozyme [Candidatus Sulfotelmatobacter sp.]